MTEPANRKVYIKSLRQLAYIQSVPGDDMAYDITTSWVGDELPTDEAIEIRAASEGAEVVRDLVEYEERVLAGLGLVNLHFGRRLLNRAWRAAGFDKAALASQATSKRRMWCLDAGNRHRRR